MFSVVITFRDAVFTHYLIFSKYLRFSFKFLCLKNGVPLFTSPLQNVSFCLNCDFPTYVILSSESHQPFFIVNVVIRKTVKYSVLLRFRDSSFWDLFHPFLPVRNRDTQSAPAEGNYSYFIRHTGFRRYKNHSVHHWTPPQKPNPELSVPHSKHPEWDPQKGCKGHWESSAHLPEPVPSKPGGTPLPTATQSPFMWAP